MKRRAFILTLAIILIAVVFQSLRRPAMPATWRKLRPDMPRMEVHSIVGAITWDGRIGKGYEVIERDTGMPGMPCFWSLKLSYDGADRLVGATAKFDNRVTSLFNSQEFSVID